MQMGGYHDYDNRQGSQMQGDLAQYGMPVENDVYSRGDMFVQGSYHNDGFG